MTFYDVVNTLKDGKCAKTPAMLGYVKRVDATKGDSDTWTKKFDIVFVERFGASDGDGYSEYKFTHTVTDGVTTITGPDHSIDLDLNLYKNLIRTDWQISDTTDAAGANTSSSTSRW